MEMSYMLHSLGKGGGGGGDLLGQLQISRRHDDKTVRN